jgi:hypothetical protein
MALQLLAERSALECRIVGEYNEMPGLRLTAAQARRLWNIDATTCNAALDDLTKAGFLRCTRDGAFVRSDRRFVAA